MATWEDPAWQGYAPQTLCDDGASADQDMANPGPGSDLGSGHTAPRIRLRSFAGNAADYKEGLLYNVPMKQLAGLLYLAVAPWPGQPRYLVSHMDIQDICTEDGLNTILKILDKEYVRESCVKADEA